MATHSSGGCACGSVRFHVDGEPVRGGLCHCMTCRKAHASAFNPFLVFHRDQVTIEGELANWESSAGYHRLFCPRCGARVVGGDPRGDEVELSIGSFDDPGQFSPGYEMWTIRREPWLAPQNTPQHARNVGDGNED